MNTDSIESLVRKVQSLPDAGARDTALELVQNIMDLHAAGLERILQILSSAEAGGPLLETIAGDALVSSLLLLHDLHPLDMETRVRRALERKEFQSRGASADLVGIRDGIIIVRIEGGPALKTAVEQAVVEAAPDAVSVVVEGGEAAHSGFVPLAQLTAT